MKFKINLKPYPGEAYFTVREHKSKVEGRPASGDLLDEVMDALMALFHIPKGHNVMVLSLDQIEEVRNAVQLCTIT